MAKKKKKNFKSNKHTVSSNISSKTQSLGREVYLLKVNNAHKFISTEKKIYELKRESANLSVYFSALLDLLADVSGVPGNVLIQKFMQYCETKQVVTNNGQIRGDVSISKYNFS